MRTVLVLMLAVTGSCDGGLNVRMRRALEQCHATSKVVVSR